MPLLAPTPRRPRWHRLVVSGVESAGPDLVIVTLDVPEEARDAFIRYDAGQYLTVRVDTPGGPASRSYSIATAPSAARATGRIRIGVTVVPGGQVSPLVARWAPGTDVDVLPPLGDLVLTPRARGPVLAIGGGSGITPVVAIAGEWVETGRDGRLTVVHVARDDARAMFAGELAALAEAHAGSVELLPVRTAVHGWPTEQSLRRLLGDRLRGGPVLVAGPEGLVRVVEAAADGPVLSEVFHGGHPD